MRQRGFLLPLVFLVLTFGGYAPQGHAQDRDAPQRQSNADLTIDFANLQFPPTISHVISATDSTSLIFGQLYIAGATDVQDEPVSGITAQVGYGPPGTHPSSDDWRWFDMRPNPGYDYTGNNDEYVGRMLPSRTGTFKFTTRWSTDGGQTWTYTDQIGPPYDEADAGDLTVTFANDTTPPTPPSALRRDSASAEKVELSWTAPPNVDGDLIGYWVYRKPAGGSFTRIVERKRPYATSYVDEDVSPGTTYEYVVTAFDANYNESVDSEALSVTVPRPVDVTFRVTVPPHTPDDHPVHLSNTIQDPSFDPDDPDWQLTEVDATTWTLTKTLSEGDPFTYRYARGAASREETQADGNTALDDRTITVAYGADGTQRIEDTVPNWRDPYVTAATPADGASGLTGSNVAVTLTWNQAMPTPPSGFGLTGPNGAVSGTWSDGAGQNQHTFTPDAPLPAGTYTTAVSGATDAAGEAQQVDYSGTWGVSALPVELAGFEAEARGSRSVALQWQTASETNNAGFEIQRLVKSSRRGGSTSPSEKTDGWQTVGSVDGAGTTTAPQSYTFRDEDVPYDADSLTYRLKQIDVDGSVSYSAARTVARSAVEQVRLLGTYPNPARHRATVRFAVPAGAAQDVTLRLYDVLGRQVRTVSSTATAGRHELQLDTSRLPNGTYFLRLTAGGTTKTQQLTVVR